MSPAVRHGQAAVLGYLLEPIRLVLESPPVYSEWPFSFRRERVSPWPLTYAFTTGPVLSSHVSHLCDEIFLDAEYRATFVFEW